MIRTLLANWIVIEAALVTCVAPIAGVATARQSHGSIRGLVSFAAGVIVFVAICGTLTRFQSASAAWTTIVQTQAVVACAALALGAIGAGASMRFRDVLDAAGLSLAIAVLSSTGVFVAGGPLADLSTGALNAAMLASPVVSAAAAANIDLFRSAFLYEHSPVAHRLFAYPPWYWAAALYALAAVLCGAIYLAVFKASSSASPR